MNFLVQPLKSAAPATKRWNAHKPGDDCREYPAWWLRWVALDFPIPPCHHVLKGLFTQKVLRIVRLDKRIMGITKFNYMFYEMNRW